ncbi:olfactory receptor 6X1-like [Crotalus tigris]|uniref:olfactory receptor 6X1-like n=1 Tax=Crotalus tigris TaxID=88082 RepID=UPI00192F7081|nr:olfactory receptor 6X1-like [Crotalus tigris]XP_039185966.1 olfactory receptor 6X1-like [Crotalus tigris]
MANATLVEEFILVGFPQLRELKMVFCTVGLLMYLLSLLGHSLIIFVVIMEPMLHTPMYFFLLNFSLAEICSTSAEVPKMLTNIILGKNTICFFCCMVQFFTVFAMGGVEFLMLSIMSFDRYMAICKPLLYKTIMTNQFILQLALVAWIGGFLIIFSQTVVIWTFPYCRDNIIDHFFCDVGPVLKLACADTTLIELIGLVYGATFMWGSLGFSLISYMHIVAAIIRISSATGRSKAFFTCASHLTVLIIFYTADMIMYLRPSTHGDPQLNKVISLVRTSFVPMLNPFIYTIRNSEFKIALDKTVRRMVVL